MLGDLVLLIYIYLFLMLLCNKRYGQTDKINRCDNFKNQEEMKADRVALVWQKQG
jgi:hypothetical protein